MPGPWGWKSMGICERRSLAEELERDNVQTIALKYGVTNRTVLLWRKYARSPNAFISYTRQRKFIRSQKQVDADLAEDDKRDDRTLAVYRALRCDIGQTAKDIAKLTGYCRETVGRDLVYLSLGDLAKRTDGKWYHTGKTLGRSFGDDYDEPPVVRLLGGRCTGHRKLKAANANW